MANCPTKCPKCGHVDEGEASNLFYVCLFVVVLSAASGWVDLLTFLYNHVEIRFL